MAHTTLIDAQTLSNLSTDCLLIDCRFSLADTELGEKHYLQQHIPGAVYAHLDRDLSSNITPLSGRHPLPDFQVLAEKLAHWGLTAERQVVVYDDTSGFFAARLWWLLRALGHTRVAVLDGGLQAWERQGLALSDDINSPEPSTFKSMIDHDAWIEVDEVQQNLSDQAYLLIDARAGERFEGREEPIDPVAGHIPGSVNIPSTDNLDKLGAFIPKETVSAHYQSVMKSYLPEQVVHSCGSGVFACFGVLAMEYAGLHGSKVYPGSWSEWIRDPERPVAIGSHTEELIKN